MGRSPRWARARSAECPKEFDKRIVGRIWRVRLAASAFALTALVFAPQIAAQTDSSPRDPHLVAPERPTVATHAGTVAPGWIEVEQGAEWDNPRGGSRSFLAATNLKIGIARNAQLNILFNLIHDR